MQLVGADRIDPGQLRDVILARDLQVRSELGKDPQIVATAAARRFVGDRLIRVVPPHELLDSRDPDAGRAGPGGPLIAVRLHVLTRKTLGGLETDLNGRALSADGTPVPGVYAAGEAAGFAAAACTVIVPWREPFSTAASSAAVPPVAPSRQRWADPGDFEPSSHTLSLVPKAQSESRGLKVEVGVNGLRSNRASPPHGAGRLRPPRS
jgi:FAD binding domain-containing protein